MGTIEELRANFTATFGSMTAGIRTIRQALQGIGQSSEEASQKSNQAFQGLRSTLSKLQAELKKTGDQGEFKGLNNAIEKAQRELKETGKVSDQSMKQLQESVQKSRDKISGMESDTKDLKNAMDRASDGINKVEGSLRKSNDKIASQTTLWERMNTRLNDARKKYQAIEDSGETVGRTFGIATAIIGGGLIYTTKKAADFGQAMSNTKSVMDPEEVNKYSKSLENLAIVQGSKTKYSATEAAEAEGELLKAGVSVSDVMHGALTGALNLATAGQISLKDAAEIASTALNAFRKDNISVAKAADILAGAANASATDVGELNYGLQQVSAVASGVGWSFKDTTVALAQMAQAGIKGSDAGTSLKTMLQNLQPQTKAQTEEFKRLGIITKDGNNQFIDAHGHFKSLSDISGILKTSLEGMTDAQRQAALEIMFGSDAVRAGNVLYEAGAQGIDKMAASMDKIKAADVAKQKLDNFKGTLEQLRGSIETASISIGNNMIPALQAITVAVQKAVDWFNSLPEPVQRFIAICVGLTAVLLGIVTTMGFVAMGIGSAIKSLGALTLLLSKFRTQAALSSKSAQTFGASAAAAGTAMDTAGAGVGKASGKVKALHGVLGLASTGLALFGGKWGMVTGIAMNFLPEIIKAGRSILSFSRVATVGGAAAGSLAGGSGAAATALGILSGPVGWVVMGLAALTAGLMAAYKYIKPFHDWVDKTADSLKNNFWGAVHKVQSYFKPMIDSTINWGKSVDKATQTALNGYVKLSDQAQKKLEELVITGKKVGKQDVAGLVKPYKQMADQVIGHFERMDKKSEEALSALKKANKKEYNQIKKDAESGTKKKQDAVKEIEGQIEKIYKNAAKNHRSITAAEQEKINKLQNKMNTYAAESMSKSQKQQEIILGKLKDHASSLTAEQAAAVVQNSKKQRDKTVGNAKDQYEKVKKHANSQYNSAKKWADQQYYALHNISKKQHDAVVKAAADQRDKTISSAKKQKDKTVGHAKDMHEKVVDQAKKQAHGHRDQVDWETGKVLSKWDKFRGSFAHVINNISGFFNGLFSKIGIKSHKLPTWKPPGYAKGTKGTQKDEVALTGEEGFELAHSPDQGVYVVGKEGPEMRYLPKGTSILPHRKSVDLLSALGIKGYASGIGDFFSGLWDKVKDGVSWASDMVFSAPKKLVNWISDKVGLGSFQKNLSDWPAIHGLSVQLPKNMFKGITDKLKDFGSSADPPGAGVERWRSSVIRALAMNGLSTSGSMVNKVLRQMQTESGGNSKAVQHGYMDINTIKGDLAKGLMQTISATFNAYKFPGHGNIFNGFDNLLAALNYAKNRYGSSLSALGKGHGYANGGWNFMHTLAEISEGDKAEVILPVENKNRTLQLMEQVLGYYGGSISRGVDKDVTSNMDQIASILLQSNQLMKEFMDLVDSKPTGITEQQIYNANKKISNQKTRIDNLARGVLMNG
ncbi:phage tail tape measure protein [Sporolactobacillus terrae]|uniref:phage tail tape measure protein n=1 Tax=Sporolactobacillus terrae TaxID=269673 RepID=UPI00048E44E3|nr:phage tail tape measure protein [Sporolactobacillus terrae]